MPSSLQIERAVEMEALNYRRAGASAIVYMTPHRVCLRKLPTTFQKRLDPISYPVTANALMKECGDFVAANPLYPEWHDRPRAEQEELCENAKMNENGSMRLARRIEVAAATAGKDVGVVDAFNITREAGCASTGDGRHYNGLLDVENTAMLDAFAALGWG